MAQRKWLVLGSLAVIVVTLLLGKVGNGEEVNLIKNPGFEIDADKDGWADSWKKLDWYTIKGREPGIISLDGGNPFRGNYSLQIEVKNNMAGVAQSIRNISEGEKYKVKGWVRTGGIKSSMVKMMMEGLNYDRNRPARSRYRSIMDESAKVPSETSNWTYIEKVVTIPKDVNVLRVILGIRPPNRKMTGFSGIVWFDDISLVKLDKDSDVIAKTPQGSKEKKELTNLLHGDSSFETGLGTLLTPNLSCKNHPLAKFEIDSTESMDGKQSLKCQFLSNNGVSGKPCSVEPGRTYTFSLYAKANRDNVNAKLHMVDTGYRHGPNKEIFLNKKWERYSITMKAEQSMYWLGFRVYNPTPVTIWSDAYQFEESDKPTPYKNKKRINVGIHTRSKYNDYVFSPDEKIKIDISVYKAWEKTKAKNIVFSYKITDFYKNVIIEEEEKLNLDKKRWFKKSLSFKTEKLGFFIVRAQIKERGNLIDNSILSFAIVKPPVKIEKGLEPFCGLCGHPLHGLKRIGVQWLEIGSHWSEIEKIKGKYNWSGYPVGRFENLFSLKKEGYKIKFGFYHLPSVPEWAWDKEELAECKEKGIKISRHGGLLPSKEYLKDWQEFIHQLVTRYKDAIDIYEIGGEDDLTLGHEPYYRQKYSESLKSNENFVIAEPVIDRYCEMITIAAREIKKVVPDAKIGAIRPSGNDCTNAIPPYTFSRAAFKKCGKEFNIFPLDPYTYPRDIGPNASLSLMPDDFLPETFKQALKLGKEYGCDQHIYVSELGWALDRDVPLDSEYAEDWVKKLTRMYLISRMTEGVDYCWWFVTQDRPRQYEYGLWRSEGVLTPGVPAYSAVARVVENVIEAKEIESGKNITAVVFKKHNKADAAVWVVKGEEGAMSISANPEYIFIFDVMGNQLNTEIRGKRITFKIGELPVYLSMNGEENFKRLCEILSSAKFHIVPVKIFFITQQIEKGTLYLQNQINQDLVVNISLNVAGETQIREVKVPKGERVPVEFSLPDKIINKKEKVKVELNCGQEFKKMVSFFPIEFERVKKVAFPIEIDGNISEWKGHPYILMNEKGQIIPPDAWIDWTGTEDLCAKVYTGWDKSSFYLAAEVTDDKHFNNKTGYKIWDGDSLQFAFDSLADDGVFKEVPGYNYYDADLGIALTKEGQTSHQWYGSGKIWERSEFAVVRDEEKKKTFYEVRIPFSPLYIFSKEGTVFGFNFVIFDDDEGVGQTYWYQNSPGITGGKDPRRFKKFVLLE